MSEADIFREIGSQQPKVLTMSTRLKFKVGCNRYDCLAVSKCTISIAKTMIPVERRKANNPI